MNDTFNTSMLALLMLAIAGGCSQDTAQGGGSHGESQVTIDTAKYLLTEEPEDAVGVITAREAAKDRDEIVWVGRIGGRKDPWIEGRAAFMMIDAAMSVVEDGEESDGNEVCMDDCCASLRAECTTLVKIVDEKGKAAAHRRPPSYSARARMT